jgi:nickel-dependent lactate racemase
MSISIFSRRSFIKGAGTAGTVPLIGTALAAGPYQQTSVPALKDSAHSVVIPTHEFTGNLDERLDFPVDWTLNVMRMKGEGDAVLTPQQITASIQKPIGTAPLREIAAGKNNAVITFDDMTRPTPAFAIAPLVLAELKAAGIKDENILFLGSFATHRPMTVDEVQRKLGKEIATKYAWLNHACFYGCKDLGTTSYKTPVAVNQNFMGADVKVTMSGIKVHYDAGYGGGAKAILPGLSFIETVEHNHNVILRQTKTSGPVRIFKNEMRLDIIEAARFAKVDFSVQTMYDQKLRPTHVFAGDIVDAHHAAVRVAAKTYCTETFQNPDIVVANAYPQNAEAYNPAKWLRYSVKPGGTGVLIIQNPAGPDPIHFLNNRTASRSGMAWFQSRNRVGGFGPGGQGQNIGLIVYSQYMNRNIMNNYAAGTQFATKWEEVIGFLKERHKGTGVQVAVYPYAGMQHQMIELDG